MVIRRKLNVIQCLKNSLRKNIVKRLSPKQQQRLIYFNTLRFGIPYPELLEQPPNNILILAPHPDDETIGCGGLLLQKRQHSDTHVLLLTDGHEIRRDKEQAQKSVAVRKQEFLNAMDFLGVHNHTSLNYPCDQLSYNKHECTDAIITYLSKHTVEHVFLPSPFDSHLDHMAVTEILQLALEKGATFKSVWFYEVWNTISPNVAIDISTNMPEKMQAIQLYKSQVAQVNYDHRIEGLNKFHGMAQHCEYAECFWRVSMDEFNKLCLRKV